MTYEQRGWFAEELKRLRADADDKIAICSTTNNSSIKWVDVRAIVFDSGLIVSRHASREEAKIAVQELLKRNPLKQYDVFEYQATGKLPELPVVWDDRTIYTNENNA